MLKFLRYVFDYFKKDDFNPVSVHEVFVTAGVPKYTRIDIDQQKRIIENFMYNENEHLLIHGPSKSGKSTLWESFIGKGKVIKIPCSIQMSLQSLYAEIIDELDVYYKSTETISEEIKTGFQAELYSKLSMSTEKTNTSEEVFTRVVPPTIGSRNLHKYINYSGKFVLLENIHYTNEAFRKELSRELHNFSDYKTKWILVGVQHKADEIFLGNRDLVGRLKELQTGLFSKEQIFEIIKLGEEKLNIKFSLELAEKIFEESQGVSALAQDICKNYCLLNKIEITQRSEKRIEYNKDTFDRTCSIIGEANKQVYKTFVNEIIRGGRSDGTTKKYYWFVRMIKENYLTFDGLNNVEVFETVKKMGQTSIEQIAVTQGLQFLNKLQEKHEINPPLLEYDENKRRLFLLDPYFKFVLRYTDILR